MRRVIGICLALMLLMTSLTLYASEGEMGHMGGISEGSNLPSTIEKYVDIPSSNTNTYQYKEVSFISGAPLLFEGTIEVTMNNDDILDDSSGTYNESYTIEATNTSEGATLERNLVFATDYYVLEGEFVKQVVTKSRLTAWEESIVFTDVTYELNEGMSTFSKAGVIDMTPGVAYFDTSIYYVAKYTTENGDDVVVSVEGSNYGYDQPWSKIETQERHINITHSSEDLDDFSATTESVLEANKTIYYDETEPFPISFAGTYNQRMEREGILTYEVESYHSTLSESDYTGSYAITTANQIEKLPIPENLDFLEGHWAEDDFKKLYSMEVFTEIPHSGMQYEAISRGDFIKALCLAMNIDTGLYEESEKIIFGDVGKDHPLYAYIMAAYDHKLVKGTGENFDIDRPISREEAFVVYIRVIGLERLGVTESPLTPFVDDGSIASWAKKEIMAGYKLGIIKGDEKGRVNPKQWISKSEAAAIINRLIDYLRKDIALDYKK